MNNSQPRTFVLVPGAWHGGFVYQALAKRLRSLGHEANVLTMSGLGERRHVANNTADLETHVEDVVSHIEAEDLQDVTLVGWSYGGMVVTGALARLPERIKAIVYLDAFVPKNGQAVIDLIPPERRALWDMRKERNLPIEPLPLAAFGVTDQAIVKFVEPRLVRQPWRTFYQPVTALMAKPAIPITYVACTGYGPSLFTARIAEMEADPGVTVKVIETSHHCMLTALDETLAALL
jgi:pimeloyl-ACP methyl ester carboxylesterase